MNETFSQLDSVIKALQSDDLKCADVRILFDGVMRECPRTESQLSSSAKIVAHPEFESGFVKIQNDQTNNLTDSEKSAVRLLLRESGPNPIIEDEINSNA